MSDEKKPEVIEDGGPAFPNPIAFNPNQDAIFPGDYGYGGMTLRDHFAGQALGGMLADPNFGALPGRAAAISYAYADAMIQARKNKTEGA